MSATHAKTPEVNVGVARSVARDPLEAVQSGWRASRWRGVELPADREHARAELAAAQPHPIAGTCPHGAEDVRHHQHAVAAPDRVPVGPSDVFDRPAGGGFDDQLAVHLGECPDEEGRRTRTARSLCWRRGQEHECDDDKVTQPRCRQLGLGAAEAPKPSRLRTSCSFAA
jgi:hypothetical protein